MGANNHPRMPPHALGQDFLRQFIFHINKYISPTCKGEETVQTTENREQTLNHYIYESEKIN